MGSQLTLLGHVELRDALEGLYSMPAGSADLVLSDLPSGATRAPTDRAPDLLALWAALDHVTAPRGVVVLMASHLAFAAAVMAAAPRALPFRYDLVWEKTLATGFFNARKRPLDAHEHLLVFTRGGETTYNPQKTEGHTPARVASRKGRRTSSSNYGSARPCLWLPGVRGDTTRYPRSVWRIPGVGTSAAQRVHHQQKPEALIERVILTYSNTGDHVVDPYAGSGVVGATAERLGRTARCFDSDPRYGRRVPEEDHAA